MRLKSLMAGSIIIAIVALLVSPTIAFAQKNLRACPHGNNFFECSTCQAGGDCRSAKAYLRTYVKTYSSDDITKMSCTTAEVMASAYGWKSAADRAREAQLERERAERDAERRREAQRLEAERQREEAERERERQKRRAESDEYRERQRWESERRSREFQAQLDRDLKQYIGNSVIDDVLVPDPIIPGLTVWPMLPGQKYIQELRNSYDRTMGLAGVLTDPTVKFIEGIGDQSVGMIAADRGSYNGSSGGYGTTPDWRGGWNTPLRTTDPQPLPRFRTDLVRDLEAEARARQHREEALRRARVDAEARAQSAERDRLDELFAVWFNGLDAPSGTTFTGSQRHLPFSADGLSRMRSTKPGRTWGSLEEPKFGGAAFPLDVKGMFRFEQPTFDLDRFDPPAVDLDRFDSSRATDGDLDRFDN